MNLFKKSYDLYGDYTGEPNVKPSSIVCRCEKCGSPVQIGDRYINADGDSYCEYCIENMTKNEVLELCGLRFTIADID